MEHQVMCKQDACWNKEPRALTVLAGGMGNQLFQYFFSVLFCQEKGIQILELNCSQLERYASARELEIGPLVEVNLHDLSIHCSTAKSFMIKCRFPKILFRLGISSREWVRVGAVSWVMDGYFQTVGAYSSNMRQRAPQLLELMRKTFLQSALQFESPLPINERLLHLRGTDFFVCREDAKAHFKKSMEEVSEHHFIVTDDEELVLECLEDESGLSHTLVNTRHMPSSELLMLFASACSVTTNGSSLAFWGALIGEARLKTDNDAHQFLFDLLTSC